MHLIEYFEFDSSRAYKNFIWFNFFLGDNSSRNCLHLFGDDTTLLLFGNHNFKTVKIRETGPFPLVCNFLSPWWCFPFWKNLLLSQAAVRVFDLGLKLILTVRSVREIRLKGMTCLFTPVILSGPSIRHLLLSTISIIVASFPVSGP